MRTREAVLQKQTTNWSDLCMFVGLGVAGPCIVYAWLICKHGQGLIIITVIITKY